MPWQCRSARPADLPGIYALLAGLGAFPGAADPRAVELRLWAVWKQTGWSPLNQVVAAEGERVLGALCFFPAGERGVLLEPPRGLPGIDPAAFVRGALEVLRSRFAYAEALLPEGDPAGSVLEAGGLPRVARILSMERLAAPGDADVLPEAGLSWRPYAEAGAARFEETVQRTLEGSRDVPAVQEALPPSEMLSSYRPRGTAPPARWLLAEAGGEDVACLILNEEEGGTLDLKYVGVVPERRGRGLGRAILGRAVREAQAGGFRRLTAAVDEANAPARAAYAALGFREVARKALHFTALPGIIPGSR